MTRVRVGWRDGVFSGVVGRNLNPAVLLLVNFRDASHVVVKM